MSGPMLKLRWGELIAVVCIVCVVAAIMLPALMRAREAATRTSCQNNLKQRDKGSRGQIRQIRGQC